MTDKTEPPKYIMVVVWKWNNGLDKIETTANRPNHDEWETNDHHYLLCRMDIRRPHGALEALAGIVLPHLKENRDVLIFLHKNPDHNFEDAHVQILRDKLSGYNQKTRIRLFGSRVGPIYYDESSLYGILGAEGNFAHLAKITGKSEDRPANLVLDKEKKKLNEQHFKYLWNYYWFGPGKLIFELAEEYKIYLMGFDPHPKKMSHYLKENPFVAMPDQIVWQ